MMQHPCNRFGFAAPHHHHQTANYPTMHHPSNYPHPMGHQQHQMVDNYSTAAAAAAVGTNGMLMDHHKPTNPWPTVPVSVPVNVSLPQQFNHLMHRNSSASGDLPLTPPADREAAAAAAAGVTTTAPSYYPMLHGPSAGYTQSHPVIDKSMTPPQEQMISHHHHHQHHHQHQEPIGWWTPAASAPPSTPSSCSSSTTTSSSSIGHVAQGGNGTADFSFHHHQMMSHHHHHQHHQHSAVQPPACSSSSSSGASTAPPSVAPPQPSEFQQRVAAALLKTHATLASRRCRRCRCPNCQVISKLKTFQIKILTFSSLIFDLFI